MEILPNGTMIDKITTYDEYLASDEMAKKRHVFEINEEDAARLGIENGELVRASSRRGSIETTARVGTKVSPGETWMPFHFPDGNANWLTNAALDKFCRIPEYKVCAIRVEKIDR